MPASGLFSAVEVYLGQSVWPDYNSFQNPDTAYLDVTRLVGGKLLFGAMGAVLVIACFGSALTGQAGAARLLYGIGRDNVLPTTLFGRWDGKRNQPSSNIILIGALVCLGAFLLSYERTAELLNFGAFLAFMAVNLAAVRVFYRQSTNALERLLLNFALPLLGFLFCFAIWWSLPASAKIAGSVWLAIGLIQIAIRTRAFQTPVRNLNLQIK